MYRVVFSGEIAAGFEPAAVFQSAKQRMKASPTQMDKVFSGRKVVLKKGMTDKEGAYYVAELQKIGMRVFLEREPTTSLRTESFQQVHTATRPSPMNAATLTEVHANATKHASDDDWAIASVHDPIQDFARSDCNQSGLAETDVNIPPYRHAENTSDPVLREPIPAQPSHLRAPSPAHIDFESLARHLAAPAKTAAIQATDAHARLETDSHLGVCDVQCPHCGKPFQLSAAASQTQQNNAMMAIRPADRLEVSKREVEESQSGSLAKLAAKITRILPGRQHA